MAGSLREPWVPNPPLNPPPPQKNPITIAPYPRPEPKKNRGGGGGGGGSVLNLSTRSRNSLPPCLRLVDRVQGFRVQGLGFRV